jgi:hypothetical protein
VLLVFDFVIRQHGYQLHRIYLPDFIGQQLHESRIVAIAANQPQKVGKLQFRQQVFAIELVGVYEVLHREVRLIKAENGEVKFSAFLVQFYFRAGLVAEVKSKMLVDEPYELVRFYRALNAQQLRIGKVFFRYQVIV